MSRGSCGARLIGCQAQLDEVCHRGTDCGVASGFPAARRSRMSPGGQPVPDLPDATPDNTGIGTTG
jgi:hypothetical protein